MAEVFNFIVKNNDLVIRFACPNHNHRIEEIVKNLCIDTSKKDSESVKTCRFTIIEGEATFIFNDVESEENDIRHEVVFFENTEYPLVVKGESGKVLQDLSLSIKA